MDVVNTDLGSSLLSGGEDEPAPLENDTYTSFTSFASLDRPPAGGSPGVDPRGRYSPLSPATDNNTNININNGTGPSSSPQPDLSNEGGLL